MTAFTKDNLIKDGIYIHYQPEGQFSHEGRKFVARFKYAGASIGPFMTCLRKHFTVEEYFGRMETESPLTIAESKGFLLSHVKKWLKEEGYPVTKAGFEQKIQDQIDARRAKLAA